MEVTYLTGWVINIISFILLAAIVDMLLPASSYQKYAKLVIGLLLLAVMLSPLWKLFSIDIEKELTGWFDNRTGNKEMATEIKKRETELLASKEIFILEESEKQLTASVEDEMKTEYGQRIVDLDIIIGPDSGELMDRIEQVDVYTASFSSSQQSKVVKEVVIDSSSSKTSEGKGDQVIADFLSKRWNIPVEQLNIHKIEEGDSLE